MSEKSQKHKNNIWYKDAIIYQLHVKAFFDSNEDGVGDFQGTISKLDYLSDLGVTCLWLLPFYPSPLKDDGYDVANYRDILPQYGKMSDLREFIREAKKRDMRIITELVINHTSDQHPWFKDARKSKDAKKRDFYVWTDDPGKYKDVRLIFPDFEKSNWAWDDQAEAYYWHRFYSHQPDLNLDNPQVQEEIMSIVDFWLRLGIDGFRLDGVTRLYEREGTTCESLPETHEFLKKLRAHIDKNFKDKILLAEAAEWPEEAVKYFGEKGDECQMAFHFALMPRMFMAVQMEDRFPITDLIENMPSLPQNAQWAIFLRNHDELTLEMVTDEERDYMYNMYARDKEARIFVGIRRRLAPLLGNDRRKIELMNVLLFTLPGTPIIYYGDEIGMGDNFYLGDRNGVRTPMQWSANKNSGFSNANPQRLYLPVIIDPEYHYETVNVENQLRNPNSLLWWTRRMIATRKSFKVFGRGSIKFFDSENNKILAYIREFKEEKVLVVINLSRYSQATELNLSPYAEYIPWEVFGESSFPKITQTPYPVSFGPYGYSIFSLKKIEKSAPLEEKVEYEIKESVDQIFEGRLKDMLESEALPSFLKTVKWFAEKSHPVENVKIKEVTNLKIEGERCVLLILEVIYKDDTSQFYFLPTGVTPIEKASTIEKISESTIAYIKCNEGRFVIYDAVYNEKLRNSLLQMMLQHRPVSGTQGIFETTLLLDTARTNGTINYGAAKTSKVIYEGRANTTIIFGKKFVLKIHRLLGEGVIPEPEVRAHLEKSSFPNFPRGLAEMNYIRKEQESMSIASLREYVAYEDTAWGLCTDEASRFIERILSKKRQLKKLPTSSSILDLAQETISSIASPLIGKPLADHMGLLGTRIGELHKALFTDHGNNDFAPQPFTRSEKLTFAQYFNSFTRKFIASIEKNIKNVEESKQAKLADLLKNKNAIQRLYRSLQKEEIDFLRIRIHGNLKLDEVLYTGKDFYIIDYEGDPTKTPSERRLKRSPLVDIVEILRSIHYAAFDPLIGHRAISGEQIPFLEEWANTWYKYSAALLLEAYLTVVRPLGILPKEKEAFYAFFNALLVMKILQELDFELKERPEYVRIPLQAALDIIQ